MDEVLDADVLKPRTCTPVTFVRVLKRRSLTNGNN